jgi:hypothetical protein
MTPTNSPETDDPIQLAEVLTEELRRTRPDLTFRNKPLNEVFHDLHEQKLTALCFSGGGIRSATFGLGIVQALARLGLLSKFDYLSTVSGGGYLGSWLSAWVHRESQDKAPRRGEVSVKPHRLGITRVQKEIDGVADDLKSPNPEPPELQHLREYSNYMSPKTGLLSADTWALIAIYLRNFFLNLTIFIPLIAAVLILPRMLFRLLSPPDADGSLTTAIITLALAMAGGALAITVVVSRLPSRIEYRGRREEKQPDADANPAKPFLNTDTGVLIAAVIPLLVSALLSATLWAWNYRLENSLAEAAGLGKNVDIWFFLLVAAAAYVFGTVMYFLLNGTRGFHTGGSVAALLAALIGGFFLWLVSQKILNAERMTSIGQSLQGFEWQVYLTVSVPLFLAIVLGAATVFVGLSSRVMTDEDREWLARYGGWVMIAGCVWIVLNALVLIAPSLLSMVFKTAVLPEAGPLDAVLPTVVSLAGAISAIVSLVGGFSEKSQVRAEPVRDWKSRILSVAPKVAAVIFLGFILVGLASVGTALIYALGFSDSLSHVRSLEQATMGQLGLIFLVLAVMGIVMACFVNVNKFSLHGAYRDRLVRAYLGASNPERDQTTFTGFDDADNLELHKLDGQTPLHIVNATVNLVGGDNLAWQSRKAASFTMSPAYCGSWAVGGYRRSKDYCVNRINDRALRLGTAMAISGAAANPNMGYYSSPVVTFLMSLFNIRLGWWLGNTGKRGSDRDWFGHGSRPYYRKASPSIAVLPLINETFGRTDENKRFLMVTDGGHFENLALYEMVLRRCKLIVLSDGAADAEFKFGEIANAIQKCKVDLGVDISFVGSMNIRGRYSEEESELKRSRFALAKITYPEKKPDNTNYVGWLLYTRPTYYKNEPRDIMNYAESNDQFPHQSTGDQMYDEKQFEAYRGLGFLTMMETRKIFAATAIGDPLDEVDDDLEICFEKDKDMRDTLFGFFGAGDPDTYRPRSKRPMTQPPWLGG